MEHKKLSSAVGIVFALTLLAGCSSNKSDDSNKNAAATTQAAPVTQDNSYGNGSDNSSLSAQQRIVYFDFDKSDLSPAAQSILDSAIGTLRSGSQHIRLEGHADERGTREYNLALGERRANSVAKYLEVNGIPSSRIETISYGKEKPADTGHTEAAWSQNRRVEIVLN